MSLGYPPKRDVRVCRRLEVASRGWWAAPLPLFSGIPRVSLLGNSETEVIDQIVEGRTEVVKAVANYEAEFGWWLLDNFKPIDLLTSLWEICRGEA
jgi:hypothetical protein